MNKLYAQTGESVCKSLSAYHVLLARIKMCLFQGKAKFETILAKNETIQNIFSNIGYDQSVSEE